MSRSISKRNGVLAPRQLALDAWEIAYKNYQLRKECPDAYHEELLRQSDEMDRQGFIAWQEWRELRLAADQAYLYAIAGGDFP